MIFRTQDVTKWHQDLIDNSLLLPGLEFHTGADLLITTENIVLTNLPDTLPTPLALSLKKIINHGLLVQVKIGGDFASSIPELSGILYKMKQWSSRPYLLNVLDMKKSKEGDAIIDGRDSGYTWNECDGACHWWQLRGGMVNPFQMRTTDIYQWCLDWLPRLRKLEEEKIHFVTRPTSQLIFPSDGRADVLSRLMSPSFSGSGVKTALKLLQELGTLANVIEYLSDPANEQLTHIEDVGKKRFEQFRKNIELPDGMIMQRLVKDETE